MYTENTVTVILDLHRIRTLMSKQMDESEIILRQSIFKAEFSFTN